MSVNDIPWFLSAKYLFLIVSLVSARRNAIVRKIDDGDRLTSLSCRQKKYRHSPTAFLHCSMMWAAITDLPWAGLPVIQRRECSLSLSCNHRKIDWPTTSEPSNVQLQVVALRNL